MTYMDWMPIHAKLTMTSRQRSGYEYHIRVLDDGTAILVAEGPVSGNTLPTRRWEFPNKTAALQFANEWESLITKAGTRNVP